MQESSQVKRNSHSEEGMESSFRGGFFPIERDEGGRVDFACPEKLLFLIQNEEKISFTYTEGGQSKSLSIFVGSETPLFRQIIDSEEVTEEGIKNLLSKYIQTLLCTQEVSEGPIQTISAEFDEENRCSLVLSQNDWGNGKEVGDERVSGKVHTVKMHLSYLASNEKAADVFKKSAKRREEESEPLEIMASMPKEMAKMQALVEGVEMSDGSLHGRLNELKDLFQGASKLHNSAWKEDRDVKREEAERSTKEMRVFQENLLHDINELLAIRNEMVQVDDEILGIENDLKAFRAKGREELKKIRELERRLSDMGYPVSLEEEESDREMGEKDFYSMKKLCKDFMERERAGFSFKDHFENALHGNGEMAFLLGCKDSEEMQKVLQDVREMEFFEEFLLFLNSRTRDCAREARASLKADFNEKARKRELWESKLNAIEGGVSYEEHLWSSLKKLREESDFLNQEFSHQMPYIETLNPKERVFFFQSWEDYSQREAELEKKFLESVNGFGEKSLNSAEAVLFDYTREIEEKRRILGKLEDSKGDFLVSKEMWGEEKQRMRKKNKKDLKAYEDLDRRFNAFMQKFPHKAGQEDFTLLQEEWNSRSLSFDNKNIEEIFRWSEEVELCISQCISGKKGIAGLKEDLSGLVRSGFQRCFLEEDGSHSFLRDLEKVESLLEIEMMLRERFLVSLEREEKVLEEALSAKRIFLEELQHFSP